MNLCNNQFESLQVRSSRCDAASIGRDRPPGCPSEKGRDRPLGCPSEKGRDRPLGCPRTAQPTVPTSAFSLIEIMVVVALLAFIIIGLVAMFNQTRQAFVSSMTQVDVMESGRMAADNIGREMEQMCPVFSTNIHNLHIDIPTAYQNSGPLIQSLLDPNDFFVNNLQEVFFVTRNNMQWNCIGYKLGSNDYTAGIGTLYRFSVPDVPYTNSAAISNSFVYFEKTDPNQYPSNFSRIIDGVVDFRLRVYDANGVLMPYTNSGFPPLVYLVPQTNTQTQSPVIDYVQADFYSNALPSYVELELGVLEDRALAHYRAIANLPAPAPWSYLTNHAAQVHIFRQRIPIRNSNSTPFP